MKEKRRDSKGRILHTGESQRTDGKYLYKYVDAFGNTKYVYAWRLTPTDPTPKGKREKPSLRELEQQIRRDIEDGIDSTGKKMTLCQLYAKQNAQRANVKKSTQKQREQLMRLLKEDKIGLAFDRSSLTWSQLQGLPVTTGDPADYERVVNRGRPYPVAKTNTVKANHSPNYHTPRQSGDKSLTMRVIDTLLHGFGDEGGRNIAVTRFVGLLLSKWVDADIEVAYNLTVMANNNTETPLPQEELDRVFDNIVEAEINKRRINGK